jgi:Na+-transporting methylmalonyl-CoA/oxaloacetate decarboxylase gamma subunit
MLILTSILGLAVVFLLVVVVALYTQIVQPMRVRIARIESKQETTESIVQSTADASLGLYFATCKQIGVINRKLGIEVVVDGIDGPITQRQTRPTMQDDCPSTKRSNR